MALKAYFVLNADVPLRNYSSQVCWATGADMC